MLAMYLLCAEYARRQKDWEFAADGRRSRKDSSGTYWAIYSKLPRDPQIADEVGYSFEQPPDDAYIVLSCQPDKSRYDLSVNELDRIERDWSQVCKVFQQASQRMNDFQTMPANPEKERVVAEFRIAQENKDAMEQRHQECMAVVSAAYAKLYFIPLEAMERMAEYGLDLHCKTISIEAPRRWPLSLPKFLTGEDKMPEVDVNAELAAWKTEADLWLAYKVKATGEVVKATFENDRYVVFDGRTGEKWQRPLFLERFEAVEAVTA